MEAIRMYVDVDFLRRLRRQRHLSLAEAAALLGKSRTTVWRYENGRVNMPSEMLLRLAEFYGVSVDQLTTAKGLPRTEF
jgi:transcriptional regulator with XRE-family HTH domain